MFSDGRHNASAAEPGRGPSIAGYRATDSHASLPGGWSTIGTRLQLYIK